MLKCLANKHIVLGVTGSIAAYKAGEIIRRLREHGAEVRVVMTQAAAEFVTPLTFQSLSGHTVYQHLLDSDAEAAMGHIQLARWADAILIAPASADFLARLRLGRADDLLMAVCLAGDVPLAVAPAMNQQMWQDPATQENVHVLGGRGVLLFGPDEGAQACGEVGPGRMHEPDTIVSQLAELFNRGSLSGQKVLITAGPTREAIDPVRYISNLSSGKMGFALAEAAVEAGASVSLISGPVALPTPHGVKRIDVVSAQSMLDAVLHELAQVDVFIAAAAVSDYRPVNLHTHKLKKHDERISLTLERNPDILATVKQTQPQIFCVGFAAETEQLDTHARDKLHRKQIDLIAANWVGPAAKETNGTFGSDTNALKLFWRDSELELPMAPKTKLAREVINVVAERVSQFIPSMDTSDNIVSLHKRDSE